MKTHLILAAATLALSVPVWVDAAQAQVRRGGARSIEGTVTGPRGASGVARSVTRGDGQRQAMGEVTGPNGRTRKASDTLAVDRGNRSASRDRSVTGFDGATRNVAADVQGDGQGGFAFSREATGRNGESRSISGDGQVTQLENGRAVDGSFTTPNGEGSFSRSNTVTDGVRTIEAASTGPNGAARASTVVVDQGTGVATRTSSATGPNGSTRAVESSAVRTDTGFDATRTVTGPNGESRTNSGSFTVSAGADQSAGEPAPEAPQE